MSTDEEKILHRAQGRRLKLAREHWGLPNAVKGAEFLKLRNSTTYSHHENGTRGMSRAAKFYADKFGVNEEWLLRGKYPPDWAIADIAAEEERPEGLEHFLQSWREWKGLTDRDLADRLNIPVSVVENWEAGRVDISAKWLRRLADIFETTAGSLLDVDPGSVGRDLLDIWRDTSMRQRETRAKIAQLRTGTEG